MRKFLFKTWTRTILTIVIALIILVIGWKVWGGKAPAANIFVATPATVTQTVNLVGTVVPVAEASLAFEVAGRVRAVPATAGTAVKAGDPLVELELGTLPAELDSALADLKLNEAETGSAEVNLSEIENEQNTLVESAYRTLLSSDLVAVSENDTYGLAAPTVSGRYTGPEGTYKVIIRAKTTVPNKFQLRTFGVEETPLTDISDTEPTPLGTHGLFIAFPDTVSNYKDTIWYVAIPNQKGGSYAANVNASKEAQRTRTRAVAEAQATLTRPNGGSTAAKEAEREKALAAVEQIRAQIAQRILRAPIDGVVTTQDAKVGETAAIGTPVVRVLSADNFNIEVRVPETDVGKLQAGDQGTLSLDAYGDARQYAVTLTRIDPGEVVVEGVPTYKGVLALNATSSAVDLKSGMTANVSIVAAEHKDVLAVPTRAVNYDQGRAYVLVISADGKTTEERSVQVGLEGSNGLVEILSGLQAGEQVQVKSQ